MEIISSSKMNSYKNTNWILMLFLFSASFTWAQTERKLPALSTAEIVGRVEGVNIEAKVQSPSVQETPLQVVCLFEYTEGDIFISPPALPHELNGMVHVDEALHGLITELRKSGKFQGKTFETLLITPPAKTIPAKKLLLVGLGNRNDFKPEIMQMVGTIGMREALRLGVTAYSHASDLKDAGISSPTAIVAGRVVQGAIEAYRTHLFLKVKNVVVFRPFTKITLLTGPAFFEDSKTGIKETIAALKN